MPTPTIGLREMSIWWQYLYSPSLNVPFDPAPAQLPIMRSPYRQNLIAGGERAGKSMCSVAYLLPRLSYGKLFWIVGPDYELPRAEFSYLVSTLDRMSLIQRLSLPQAAFQTASVLTKTGITVQTRTAADVMTLASKAPDGILLVEAAQTSYEAYLRCLGRVAETKGWLLLSGTFEDSEDWYADLWESWLPGLPDPISPYGRKSWSLASWENTRVFPLGLQDPIMLDLQSTMTPERFMERHAGRPAPPSRAVFPEFSLEKHVGEWPYDPRDPIEVCIDPGFAGAYCVNAVQWDGHDVFVVDQIYAKRTSNTAVIKEVLSRPWASKIDPSNAGVIDIAGRAHRDGNASEIEKWAMPRSKGGAGWSLRSGSVGLEDGINRYRDFLIDPVTGVPRLHYNATTTIDGQREHRQYRYPKDQTDAGRSERRIPIDSYNHSIKAITYWLVARYGLSEFRLRQSIPFAYVPGEEREVLNGSLIPSKVRRSREEWRNRLPSAAKRRHSLPSSLGHVFPTSYRGH